MPTTASSLELSEADPYDAMHTTLITIHRGLQGAFAEVLALPPSDTAKIVGAAAAAGGFLLGHHRAESSLLFPALRRSGILRSTDVAFLEGLDGEHQALHESDEPL